VITEKNLQALVAFFNEEISHGLKNRLTSLYLIGSYASGNVSLSRPDINWLLIHQKPISDESRWILGEIITSAIDKFLNDIVICPELRPFKFSYPLKRGPLVFVNFSIVTSSEDEQEFKRINFFIPEYVFAGFKAGRKLIFGEDLLSKFNFSVTSDVIHKDAPEKISSHKIQLDRVPLAYHMERDVDLIYNESLSHGKNLLYFGVELVMSEEELRNNDFLSYYRSDRLIDFYRNRFPEASDIAQQLLESKENFDEWKKDKNKAKQVYLAASKLCDLLFSKI